MAVSHLRNLFSNYSNKPTKRRSSPQLLSANETTKRRQHSAPYEGGSPHLGAGRRLSSSTHGDSDHPKSLAQIQADRSWLWNQENSPRGLSQEFKQNDIGTGGKHVRRESGGTSRTTGHGNDRGNLLVGGVNLTVFF